jgi:hypothetical protein
VALEGSGCFRGARADYTMTSAFWKCAKESIQVALVLELGLPALLSALGL